MGVRSRSQSDPTGSGKGDMGLPRTTHEKQDGRNRSEGPSRGERVGLLERGLQVREHQGHGPSWLAGAAGTGRGRDGGAPTSRRLPTAPAPLGLRSREKVTSRGSGHT